MSESTDPGELYGSIAKGTAWVVALRFSVRMLGIVSTVILARILIPEDFGLVALASVIAGSVELFGAFNFDIWLVRHTNPQRDDYDSVWTLALVRNLCVAGLLVALALPASAFFGDPRLVNVLLVLALATAIVGFRNIGIVDFRRLMQFDREFRLIASAKLGSFIVTVVLAIMLRNYWALLGGILVGRVLKVGLSYVLHPYRPSFSFSKGREVFDFSKWLLTLSMFGFLYNRIQDLSIGKIMGSEALGLYSVSNELSGLTASELLMPLRRVLVPAYSKIREDLASLRESFADTYALILLFGIPLSAGIGLVAEPLVSILLGEKWLQAIPLIQILVIYALASVCIANQGPVLMALGRTRVLSNLYGFGLLLKVPAVIWAASSGDLVWVAIAVSSVHLALFAVSIIVTLKTLGLPWGSFVAKIWRILFAGCLMSGTVYLVQHILLPATAGHTVMLLCSVVTGALTYTTAILLLWLVNPDQRSGEAIAINLIRQRLLDTRNRAGN